jgi:hypothetical protein
MAPRSTRVIKNRSFPLNQKEAAMLSNVDPATLARWSTEDNPPPRDPDGSYPAREFGMWMMKYQTQKRGSGLHDPRPFAPAVILKMPDPRTVTMRGKSTDKNEVEIRLKEAQALKVEMENATTAANLIPIEQIEPALANMVVTVKNRLLKLPVALAPLVLGDDDMYSIQQKLMDGVRDALSEVSVDWKSGITDEAGTAE